MARFYSNENFPLPVVVRLRELGHDVLTIQETGKADQAIADREVLAFASGEGRAVLTLNRRHFIKLHQVSTNHAGIVVCTVDSDFTALAERISHAVVAQDRLAGHLIRINRPPR
jgi:predicted nuclease of predicted toxin-antitoxin system